MNKQNGDVYNQRLSRDAVCGNKWRTIQEYHTASTSVSKPCFLNRSNVGFFFFLFYKEKALLTMLMSLCCKHGNHVASFFLLADQQCAAKTVTASLCLIFLEVKLSRTGLDTQVILTLFKLLYCF